MNQDHVERDDELRGIGMAAFHEYEVSVSRAETESALRAVRARIEAGESDVLTPIPVAGTRRQRVPWVALGAAAAAIALISGGLVAVLGGAADDTLVPAAEAPVSDPAPGATTTDAGPVATPETTVELSPSTVDDAAPEPVSTTVVAPADPVDEPPQALAIPRNCVGEFACTQLSSAEDGRIVAYDPTDRTVRLYDEAGTDLMREVAVELDVPGDDVWFVDVGPDDVAYLSIPTHGVEDPVRDLLAVALVGDRAGKTVMSWTGLDGTGDSALVPRRAGLIVVSCCGPRVPRPAPDAPIYRWVDRNGELIESTAPSFDLTLGDAGSSLTRIDGEATFTRFTLPTMFQYPRDFPTVVATDDGGALALDFDATSGGTVIVDFNTDWPEFGIDNGDVYSVAASYDAFGSILLEPSGTVVVVEDGRFVRRTLDEIGTRGWPGVAEIDFETGVVTAPGLNDYIDANGPDWAGNPRSFAHQLKPSIGANETVTVEYVEPRASSITITTSGFLDDSVAASQLVIRTEIGEEGLLRFVSGTYGFRCQPGRGHQDFSLELCR